MKHWKHRKTIYLQNFDERGDFYDFKSVHLERVRRKCFA